MGIDCYKLYVSGLGISLPSKVSLQSSFIGTSGGMGQRAKCTDYDYLSAGKSKAAESITESLVSTKTKTPIDTKELTDLSTNSFCLLLEASFIPMLQRAQSANDNGCVSSTCGRVCCPKAKVFFWTKVLGKPLLTTGQKRFSMVKSVFRPS